MHLLAVIAAFGSGLAGLLSLAAGLRGAQANEAKWTLSIELSTRNAHVMAGLVRELESDRGDVTVSASHRTLRIAAPPREIERLARIIREVDDPDTAGQRIWTIRVPGIASNRAEWLEALAERDHDWPTTVKIPKIIPDDVGHRVIVLADEPGYVRIKQLDLEHSRAPACDCGPIKLPIGPSGRD